MLNQSALRCADAMTGQAGRTFGADVFDRGTDAYQLAPTAASAPPLNPLAVATRGGTPLRYTLHTLLLPLPLQPLKQLLLPAWHVRACMCVFQDRMTCFTEVYMRGIPRQVAPFVKTPVANIFDAIMAVPDWQVNKQ